MQDDYQKPGEKQMTLKTKHFSISIFKLVLALFVAFGFIAAPANAQAPVRASYDGPLPFTPNPANPGNWMWTGGATRTIYNPLDGGVLMKYSASIADSDGCSAGAPREKQLYQQACFAHDTDYDAPFPLAGFPSYPDKGSTGQDISDFLLFKDMQLINHDASAQNSDLNNFINDSAANSFYAAVTVGGTFRGKPLGKTVLAKGGVIAVVNNGAYLMTLAVTWTGPDGTARSYSQTKPVGFAAVVPLSVGAKNITATCSAVAGTTIFTKHWDGPGMYPYTVHGTTLIHRVSDGLSNTLQTHKDPNLTDYHFTVKTADLTGAGTDSNISYIISGTQGPTVPQVSNPAISGNAYERNQTDTFTLSYPQDVGTIRNLLILSDGKYAGSAWDIEYIIIKKDGDPHSYVFQIHAEINDTNLHSFSVSEVR